MHRSCLLSPRKPNPICFSQAAITVDGIVVLNIGLLFQCRNIEYQGQRTPSGLCPCAQRTDNSITKIMGQWGAKMLGPEVSMWGRKKNNQCIYNACISFERWDHSAFLFESHRATAAETVWPALTKWFQSLWEDHEIGKLHGESIT